MAIKGAPSLSAPEGVLPRLFVLHQGPRLPIFFASNYMSSSVGVDPRAYVRQGWPMIIASYAWHTRTEMP